jgi:aldehyde dehydrogenase (NAD+)
MLQREYPSLFIGGAWRSAESPAVFDVVSPYSEQRIGWVPAASPADIDAAVTAARRAFDETDRRQRPAAERAELGERLAAAIHDHADLLRESFSAEPAPTEAALVA